MDRIFPATNLHLVLRRPGVVRPVRALRPDRDLPFAARDGQVDFMLPRLDEFEMIVTKREGTA